jgi:hypothetical protein
MMMMKITYTRYFTNESGKCLRDSGGDKKIEFRYSVNEVVKLSRFASLLKRRIIFPGVSWESHY